ncbi:MAG: carbamoyl-phosphate synthase small subunit, partial [Pseudomonadota bacterium]
MKNPAMLVLEDGTVFHGESVGIDGQTVGEVVFNTAITGYQEILTDPSYARQLVTLTYPHIGNTGTNHEDEESSAVHAAGLIIRDLPRRTSNWRSEASLDAYLAGHGVVAIADIDTRKLTRILREKGAQSGCIVAGSGIDEAQALAAARGFAGLKGMDLAKFVSTDVPYQWSQGTTFGRKPRILSRRVAPYHVVAYDFGI